MFVSWSYGNAAEVMTNDQEFSWIKLLWIVPKFSGGPNTGENIFVTYFCDKAEIWTPHSEY